MLAVGVDHVTHLSRDRVLSGTARDVIRGHVDSILRKLVDEVITFAGPHGLGSKARDDVVVTIRPDNASTYLTPPKCCDQVFAVTSGSIVNVKHHRIESGATGNGVRLVPGATVKQRWRRPQHGSRSCLRRIATRPGRPT